MPLQMGDVSSNRDQIILFDPNNLTERTEAENKAAKLMKAGFLLGEKTDSKIELLHPKRDPNQGLFRILSENGDDHVVWDRRDPQQVREAFAKFKEFQGKGYTAYATNSDGKKGHKIEDFDPGLEEIILVPSTMPG